MDLLESLGVHVVTSTSGIFRNCQGWGDIDGQKWGEGYPLTAGEISNI